MRRQLTWIFLLAVTLTAAAQKSNPMAYYINEKGEEAESTNITDGQAPLEVTFRANPEGMDGYTPSFEWHFRHSPFTKTGETQEFKEFMVRYEEDTQYTFTESGIYHIVLLTRLSASLDPDSATIVLSISDSKLEFPNAFSPNHDGRNELYQAKTGWRNIVSFHAYIFNRWGQKLFEWTDPNDGWDGTYKGKDVKEGTYFVLVKARGADGKEYNIKKDVNLLRNYYQGSGSNSSSTAGQ
jgi:gliding motility-associated-like protein